VARPPSRYCLRGHDLSVVGRYGNGQCKQCSRLAKKERGGSAATPMTPIRLCEQHGWECRYWCRTCRPLIDAAYRMQAAGMMVPAVRLRRLTDRDAAVVAWARHRGCKLSSAKRAVERLYSEERIVLWTADEWCVALGVHLANVYPEAYVTVQEYQPVRRQCGTMYGYRLHWEKREPICPECSLARSEYDRSRRAAVMA
jgi:hypothetical protein